MSVPPPSPPVNHKLEQRLKLQEIRSTAIRNIAAEGETGSFASLSRSALAFKMGALDTAWNAFSSLHLSLFEGKFDGLLDTAYVKKDMYNLTFKHYNAAKVALLERKEELEGTRDIPTGATLLETSFAQLGGTLLQKLPEVPLPTFSGDYLEWTHFHEMFTSLIGTNEAVTPVVKMHYLRTSLKDEAADVVANLPITGEAFATAWDLLVNRYDNPRRLLFAHIAKLLAREKIAPRSAKALDELLRSTKKALDAIQALNVPTASWDPLLVHLTINRLDDRLRESWENKLGSSNAIPSYSELQIFLIGRARAMETIEISTDAPSESKLIPAKATYSSRTSATKPTFSRSSASVNLSSVAAATDALGLCAICSEKHFVLFCPTYRAKSIEERIEAVRYYRLCFNCLGRHRIADCRTKQTCQKCGEYHHTSIHIDRPSRDSQPQETPTSTVPPLSPSDEECEKHFINTHSRDASGRYIVRLPLNSSATQLGNSLSTARSCLQSTLRRLAANPSFSTLYNNFMSEYDQLEHMKVASSIVSESLPVYYLPHHGVLKEQSTTTKLRVVFNGSSNTSSGVSLNDILHSGPKIQINLSDVLLWARRHRFVFATDITKMFRQIKVHPLDWDLQRILWVDQHHQVVPYQLTTVTYGTRCAPFLAVRTLLQLVNDEGHRFPLAVDPLTKGRYVDDIYGGADSVQDATLIAQQLTDMCSAGGFPLAKWASNSPELLAQVSPAASTTDDPISFEESTIKVLGLTWHPPQDKFKFTYFLSTEKTVTKRSILSETARLFDPLGFLAPLVIRAKMLLQELWLEKLGWDEPLSPVLTHKWLLFRDDLRYIELLEIPRWLHLSYAATVEIHGFADASQLAMAAVIFLKVTATDGSSTISLVCAKTQVAPLKHLTIPRLELNAAVILSQLTRYVQTTLELGDVSIVLWTDSAVALTWIRSHPSRWKEYVCNRVTKIQELQPSAKWRFIAGKQNPADCASRGLCTRKLKQHSLWWHGPPWILQPCEEWPTFDPPAATTAHLEEKPGLFFNVAIDADTHSFWDLITRYSSLLRLKRTTAICLRFIARLKKVPHSSLTTPLTTADLETARVLIVKIIQQYFFAEELRTLAKGNQLAKSNHLTKLTPFLDHQGVLRVGGRLKHSLLDTDQKHPAIVPRGSPLTTLLIADAHHRTLHGGTQLTLAYLRRSYWIIGGRAPVRSFILRCVTCTRHRGLRAQQLMGQLPTARITPSRAFLHTGIDYAGPITLKAWKGRGSKAHKGWIAVFVCFATSAIHLEVVTDYSSDAFIAAYRRFASRRGICHTLYSDCGTNFAGADATLKSLFKVGSKELRQLATLLSNDGTNWVFNPPGAPHFGGKWEAAVKSLKFHLQRVIGETLLTYEEMTTFLNQVEAVLNSRPLAPLSEDPADLEALTPGHFLIGEPLTSVPSPSLSEIAETRLSKWQLIQQRTEHFWNRWSAECLHRYQSISKWHHPSNEIKVGSMVFLTDERLPPTKWPIARVLSLHPGKDGLTRVVTIKTATSTLTRPIAKLCVLPVSAFQEPFVNAVAKGVENVE